jgi:hypothetical protein
MKSPLVVLKHMMLLLGMQSMLLLLHQYSHLFKDAILI